MRRPLLVPLGLVLVVLVLLAAGCGGKKTKALPDTVIGTLPAATTTTSTVQGDATAGKQVFASAGCGGCHTLKDAGATGNVGPNLDQTKPALAKILDRVTNGKSPMPSFKGQLTDKQIADVAAYVFKSTHS
jgi:mono/diheme cytochrome c family protein